MAISPAIIAAAITASQSAHDRAGAGDTSVTGAESTALANLYAALKIDGCKDPLDYLIVQVTERGPAGVNPFKLSPLVHPNS